MVTDMSPEALLAVNHPLRAILATECGVFRRSPPIEVFCDSSPLNEAEYFA